jgi:lipoyl(octanoyl) transferase
MSAQNTLGVARLGTIDYAAALALQERMLAARQQDRIADVLLLLEHPHVYTLGRGASEAFLLNRPAEVPLYRVSRGGEVTYHGPGQLVGYPIIKLEGAARDVHAYLRRLEDTMIGALGEVRIDAGRRERLTGVWIGERKIASIGVCIRRWVTMHGFALNVTTDLGYFERIVPCGIDGCVMTSIAAQGRADVTVGVFAHLVERNFAAVFGYAATKLLDRADLDVLIDAGRDNDRAEDCKAFS